MKCHGMLCLAGRLFDSIQQSSGVKQGDPASMVLFVLAYDPILRLILRSLRLVDPSLSGMCDDVALAVIDIFKAWHRFTILFDLIEKFAALKVNCLKTQFIFADLKNASMRVDEMVIRYPSVSISSFDDVIRYLGIHIGPGAHQKQWLADYNGQAWQQLFTRHTATVRSILGIASLFRLQSLYHPLR